MFEAIESIRQLANIGGVLRIDKPWELIHEHLLLEKPMKEGVLYIKLFDDPSTIKSNGENNVNGLRLDNRAEGFSTVNSFKSSESVGNKPCLQSLKTPISF